jgi:hypothetical protein
MSTTEEQGHDAALDALTALSEVAASSADELSHLDDEFTDMRRRRMGGWSWQRILSASGSANPMSAVARIVDNLGRAGGGFRRSLIRALQKEGMQVTEIGKLLGVSRQRASELFHRGPKKSAKEER